MNRRLRNIFDLGVKELRSLRRDPVLLFLVGWAFTVGVITPGRGAGDASVHNARIAIVDEDRSALSERIADSFYPPYFRPPRNIPLSAAEPLMDQGEITFVLVIPQGFERDLIGDRSDVQLLVDATRMKQAGIGAGYIERIVRGQVKEFLEKTRREAPVTADLVVRTKFNPNLVPAGFQGLVALINHTTLLTVLLTGAAVIREREYGTIEHALAMPITSVEIMLGKLWATALVMTAVVITSLTLVVRGVLDQAIAGSLPLLVTGVVIYLFAATSIGIFLATVARTMPQLGLLAVMVVIPMNMLSGNNTPLEAQPVVLQWLMQFSPSTHFVSVAQAVIFRGATLAEVWIQLSVTAGIGVALFLLALLRFRSSMAAARG
ncbi:ABC transporter permease [Thiohalomonas denitrificans]|uniref:ABC-2 type transport system permease protein n=1 Tax=Thiohalomonas denitrificans TaxID=415747 RepID=A0A1G5QN11_9GAMM|nr:ABC transporter permease [Thiohalomonas denitrificans]SCZ63122.1 ABC-2 type transport system permease protein [Thiohalomonas denitrificans]